MKRIICLIIAVITVFSLSSCANETPAEKTGVTEAKVQTSYEKIDIDLASMSGTIVYSEVNNLVSAPEENIGKVIRMKGNYTSNYIDETKTTYYFCLIQDATACCQQGLEFVLANGADDPSSYPPDNTEITVTGVFESYKEGAKTYYHIADAEMTY